MTQLIHSKVLSVLLKQYYLLEDWLLLFRGILLGEILYLLAFEGLWKGFDFTIWALTFTNVFENKFWLDETKDDTSLDFVSFTVNRMLFRDCNNSPNTTINKSVPTFAWCHSLFFNARYGTLAEILSVVISWCECHGTGWCFDLLGESEYHKTGRLSLSCTFL